MLYPACGSNRLLQSVSDWHLSVLNAESMLIYSWRAALPIGQLLSGQSSSTEEDLKLNVKRAVLATFLAEQLRDKLIVRGPERAFG